MEDIRYLLESAESLDGGVTNDVWATDDKIVKRYSRGSLLGSLLKAAGISKKEIEDLGPAARVENEKAAEKYFFDKQIQAPEILHNDYLFDDDLDQGFKPGHYAIFEKVDGASLGESVEDLDLDQTYELAKAIGESLSELHEDDSARRDSRGENLMYDLGKNPDLYWIDNEFFTDDASEFEKSVDIFTFLGEAHTYPNQKSVKAIEGLDDGYSQKEIEYGGDFRSKILSWRLIADDFGSDKLTNYIENNSK